jgi:uncharacterized DUF497 family protein
VKNEPSVLEWDAANLRRLARHAITPAEAEEVMENDPTDLGYDVVKGEPRWTVVGHTNLIRVLVVMWTVRGEKVRIVTAWQAPRKLLSNYLRSKRAL